MAQYNAWQNIQLTPFLNALPDAEFSRDRGAFFGSIKATLNHLLWGDTIWMSRFDGGAAPSVGIPESSNYAPDLATWIAMRGETDARIQTWANGLQDSDLAGDLTWYSGAAGAEMTKSRALCVMQLFNHQTHHRGQVHAMLTATGSKAPVSDLPFMPEPE